LRLAPSREPRGGRRSVRVQVVKVPPLVGRLLQLILGLWSKR
jgi:hypothetical protein